MKREYLTSLGIEGLTKEVIDGIMLEHGKTVNANKDSAEETARLLREKITALEARADITPEKLTEIQDATKELEKKLKAFDGVDIADLNNKLSAANTKILEMETASAEKVRELTIDAYVRERLAPEDFSSAYARKGIYQDVIKMVTYENDSVVGLDEALKKLREEQPEAWAKEEPQEGTKKNEGIKHGQERNNPPRKEIPTLI